MAERGPSSSAAGAAASPSNFSVAFLVRWFITDGYLWDWLFAAIVIIVNNTVPLGAVKPVDRFYLPSDATLSYPAGSSTISGTVLWLLVFILPLVLITIYDIVCRDLHDWCDVAGHVGRMAKCAGGVCRCKQCADREPRGGRLPGLTTDMEPDTSS